MKLVLKYWPAIIVLLGCAATLAEERQPADLSLKLGARFTFVAYGDTRFTDPKNADAANALVRETLVKAIGDVHPAFISIGGDIAYNGNDPSDWMVWDTETAIWREKQIPVFPALGNHDLHGDQKIALANYFQRFPQLNGSRYYSVNLGSVLMLVLDSSLDETSGPQGEWLNRKLDGIAAHTEFVCIVLHHPPYTSSSDKKLYGGGHSARSSEMGLASLLEERQGHLRPRIVVFSGHVHNYERHVHNGVTYFVTGGGGAHAYPIERDPGDLFPDKNVNFHYLLVEVTPGSMVVTMNRLSRDGNITSWTSPDKTEIKVPSAMKANAALR